MFFVSIGSIIASLLGFGEPEYKFHADMTMPDNPDAIFVFGSNLLGEHSGGAARLAFDKFDAEWGVGDGMTGQSYAIPTCGLPGGWPKLSLDEIQEHIHDLAEFADISDQDEFFITRLGTGITGYTDADIAPMFKGFPSNVNFPEEWRQYL